MSISKCIVRLKDCHDTEHSVEVYAESLYEAVLRGLNRLQDIGWESNGNETIQRVEVGIHQEPTRHIVDVPKLLKWIQEDSGYPAQQTRPNLNPNVRPEGGKSRRAKRAGPLIRWNYNFEPASPASAPAA